MDEKFDSQMSLLDNKKTLEPVSCLGKTFNSNEERRAYFTDRLKDKLTELKKTKGFPLGEEGDILELSDPPYYTACPNPFIPEFIDKWNKEKKELYPPQEQEYHREPFAADVSEGKNDPVYNAHGYHTKVPYKAIMRYILHYTQPGDIVFDGFCGTGMTGVAANMCARKDVVESLGYVVDQNRVLKDNMEISKIGERRAVLCDLSTAASFIAYNYNTPIDVNELDVEAEKVIRKVEERCLWMYQTNHVIEDEVQKDSEGNPVQGRINYIVWSDVFICPSCSNEVVFFDEAVDRKNNAVKSEFACPHCTVILGKSSMERAKVHLYDEVLEENIIQSKQIPVLINYTVGRKRFVKTPDENDSRLYQKINGISLRDYRFPSLKLPKGYNTAQPISSHGFTHAHHFYTKRNLITLASLMEEILKSHYSLPLRLIFQSIVGTLVSKLVRYNMGNRGNGVLTGTLYVASMIAEAEVTKVFKGKIKDFKKAFVAKERNVLVCTQPAQTVPLPDNSVDYIFTDPPFGANIMYSELNFLWESWLGILTNSGPEAIVNEKQGKDLVDYRQMMTDCFKNFYRVLKPGRWITVEFSNSKASVWNAIQEAIQRAGFIISNVSALDKKQGSFKAVTTTIAVKQDLVISAYKPASEMEKAITKAKDSEESAWVFVRKHLEQLPKFFDESGSSGIIVERTPRVLFDRMVAYHVRNGYDVPISSGEFQAGVVRRFPMRDGMVFLESQVAEYDRKRASARHFVQMHLFVSDENSAIEWLRQRLLKRPQTRQDLYTDFIKEIQHISRYEKLPELDTLLEQNFLRYDGEGPVPSQIHSYLSSNFKDCRERSNEDSILKEKAKDRWYVADPNKQADLERLREKSLLREFQTYVEEINRTGKRLKQFRLEALRVGFKRAWGENNYKTIIEVGSKIPENILQEDNKLLMYYDNAQIRLGM